MIQIGNAKIYTGDCIEVMQGMPDESVDLCITSPPWNIGQDYGEFKDNVTEKELDDFTVNWLSELFRISSDGAHIYIVLSDQMMFDLKPVAEKIGWIYGQVLIWCKSNMCSTSRITKEWGLMHEFILMMRKGKRTKMINNWVSTGTTTHSWRVIATPQSNFNGYNKRIHPAQFPIELPEWLISRTPGNVVLDPFMGVGAVGIACQILGREFIGIELNPEFAELSKTRIQLEGSQTKLALKEASQEKLNL